MGIRIKGELTGLEFIPSPVLSFEGERLQARAGPTYYKTNPQVDFMSKPQVLRILSYVVFNIVPMQTRNGGLLINKPLFLFTTNCVKNNINKIAQGWFEVDLWGSFIVAVKDRLEHQPVSFQEVQTEVGIF